MIEKSIFKDGANKNLTHPLTRAGISLIVLVITIIVIIILAAAIIISLNNNNPVMEANKARYDSDVANMQAVFTNAVAKVMAKNQGTVSINAGQINEIVVGQKEVEGKVSYTVVDAQNVENTSGIIIFGKGENTDTEFYIGKKLPIYTAGDTKWYVDEEGNISLTVGSVSYGNGPKILDNVVVDYAKPFELEYKKIGDSRIVVEKSHTSYGDIQIEGDNTSGNWKLTYTLNKFLSDVDEIHLVCENGQEYIVNVIPANNIYYEDDFITDSETGRVGFVYSAENLQLGVLILKGIMGI